MGLSLRLLSPQPTTTTGMVLGKERDRHPTKDKETKLTELVLSFNSFPGTEEHHTGM